MATSAQVSSIVTEVSAAANTVLGVLSAVDPQLAIPDTIASQLLVLVGKAMSAWSAASGIAITAESVQALDVAPLPGPEPTV